MAWMRCFTTAGPSTGSPPWMCMMSTSRTSSRSWSAHSLTNTLASPGELPIPTSAEIPRAWASASSSSIFTVGSRSSQTST